jgi:hypothetical protein
MWFTLCALGRDLEIPDEAAVEGALADAMREAEAMLESDPHCEAVEIFGEGRFLGDLRRRLN